MRVKITLTIPKENANDMRAAIGGVGAGQIGEYSYCSFTVSGEGRYLPSINAKPLQGQGTPGVIEILDEEQIEVSCERDRAKEVVAKIRASHPYEEPVIHIYELIDEGDL